MLLSGILPRYIAQKYMMTFTYIFLIIVTLIFLVDFSENARRFSNLQEYSATTTAILSALRIPDIIQIAIPFVVLIASMSALMNLNRKNELVIARASGLSAWQFLSPIIICNLIIGILCISVLNPMGAAAARLANEIATEAGFGQKFNQNQNHTPWLRQITDEGTTIIGGRSSANNGSIINQVTFLRLDHKKVVKDQIYADRATLKNEFWFLENARIIVKGEPVKSVPELKIKTNLRVEFIAETFSTADQVSFFALPGKIRAAHAFGLNAHIYAMKLHQLIALPAFLVAMTLIAAMVSLNFVRFGASIYAILAGIICGFLLYVLSELITAFGKTGAMPAFVAAWIPVILALTVGITVLLYKEDG